MSTDSVPLKFYPFPSEMQPERFCISCCHTAGPSLFEKHELQLPLMDVRQFLSRGNLGPFCWPRASSTWCHCGTFPQQTGCSSTAFKNFPRIIGQIPAKGIALTWIRLGRNKVKEKKQLLHSREHVFPDSKSSSCTRMADSLWAVLSGTSRPLIDLSYNGGSCLLPKRLDL